MVMPVGPTWQQKGNAAAENSRLWPVAVNG